MIGPIPGTVITLRQLSSLFANASISSVTVSIRSSSRRQSLGKNRILIQGRRFEEAALSRGDLTEVEWRILKGLLPIERAPGKRGRGRLPKDNRNIINGVLWRLRTGAPWRDVPEKYGNWNSIYRRFRRWSACGVWESVAIALAETMAEREHYNIDSTSVRAHVSAAGGKGGFINELLAARGAGSPVKFIVSVMPEDAPSPSTSRLARRPTARAMTR